MSTPSVLLIGMPFASVDRPNLSVATLQGHLRREGYRCDARYASLDLAARVGPELQEVASLGAMAGEWLFVPALYGGPIAPDDVARYADFAGAAMSETLTADLFARLVAARGTCEEFVDELAGSIRWEDYDAVGFSVVFQQTLASLALARRIKAAHPELPVLFGGANLHGDMGVALHERFDCIDIVATGEADDIVIDLFAAVTGGGSLDHIPGIVHRRNGESVVNEPAPAVTDLDALPFPDFDDWFVQQAAAGFGQTRSLTLETSRGCWWGAISHCTFCGLNGSTMSYRSKSADRAFREITELYDRHEADFVTVADNIFDMRYLRSLLPRLTERQPPIPLYFEIRPKLKRDQVARLAAAGVQSVLPGIESFSDHSLELMGKATTGLEGVQLLKYLAEFGIAVDWNYLYGTPGETEADHRAAETLVRACRHLSPPKMASQVQIHRFSPLHERPEELGFVNLRAESVYALLYPFDQETLDRIAYVFEADFAEGADEACRAEGIVALVEQWNATDRHGGLWEVDDDVDGRADDGAALWIHDERSWTPASPPVKLVGWRAALYRRCDHVVDRTELVTAAEPFGIGADRVDAFLDWCRDRGYLVDDGDRWVSLTVHHPPRWPAAKAATSERTRLPVVAS